MRTTLNPLREMDELARAVSRLLGEPVDAVGGEHAIPVDLLETDEELVVLAYLPGVRREDVAVEVEGRVLSLTARRELTPVEAGEFLHLESAYGSMTRRITLGEGVRPDAITAGWRDGVLTVRVPKADAVKPRRIPVADEGGSPDPANAA